MTAWRWVGLAAVHAIHDRQLAEHGGLPGVRDLGAIESALARPQNLAAYGEPDAADLAAAYAYGLARNHGFADGNKRTAWVAARVFLADNGYGLRFEPIELFAPSRRSPPARWPNRHSRPGSATASCGPEPRSRRPRHLLTDTAWGRRRISSRIPILGGDRDWGRRGQSALPRLSRRWPD